MMFRWVGSIVLLGILVALGVGLAVWKRNSIVAAETAAAAMPEPAETITVATVRPREHRRTTTSIGTVFALRSVTLRNELAGTVSQVQLTPGQVVDEGTLLVALDTSVEEAELKSYRSQAELARTQLERVVRLKPRGAATDDDVDSARSERDVALAQVERVRAIIARKTIRAPFRARVGISDVHVGQYLPEGTTLTTLQGVDEAAHVDFAVTQPVAATLQVGDVVEILAAGDSPVSAAIAAVDARVDPATRNATVRARVAHASRVPPPGASVRVRVPVGDPIQLVSVPVSALRKGPDGDFVFVIATDEDGQPRARQTAVRSGLALGDEILIYSGVAAGDQVAASGSFKLRDGALVAPLAADASADPPAQTASATPAGE